MYVIEYSIKEAIFSFLSQISNKWLLLVSEWLATECIVQSKVYFTYNNALHTPYVTYTYFSTINYKIFTTHLRK